MIVFLGLVFSCDLGLSAGTGGQEITGGGGVTITLPAGNTPSPGAAGTRSITGNLNRAVSPSDIIRFDAILENIAGATSRTVSGQPGETLTFQNVEEGLYTLTLNAFNDTDIMQYTGTTPVTVKNGETANAHIVLDYVSGEIGIEISFPLDLKGVDKLGPFNANPADHLISDMTNGVTIAMSDNGDYAVLWRRDTSSSWDGYFMKLYYANGTPKCDPIQIASTSQSDYYNIPKMGMDRNGNVVVAYVDYRQVTTSGYARFHMVKMYSADGVLTKSFQVNNGYYTYTAPGFAMNADGDFIVGTAWTAPETSWSRTTPLPPARFQSENIHGKAPCWLQLRIFPCWT